MERPIKLGAVRVVSASEVEVTVHFPSGGANKESHVFTLQQTVKKGMSPKGFIAQLSRDLKDRIGTLRGWSEEEISERHVMIQFQKDLEGALFTDADFRNKFAGQFTRMAIIKHFSIKKGRIDIVYEEVSPVMLYRMLSVEEEHTSPQAFLTNTTTYALRNFKNSENFLFEFAKDIGKQVDDIWISDRLKLKNAVLRYFHNRSKLPTTLLKSTALFLGALLLVFSVINYILTMDYREPKPELTLLKEKLSCLRTVLERQGESGSMRNSVFDELDNMELFLQGLGETTSDDNIQFISTEIKEFQEKLSLEGIYINDCP